MFVEIKNLNFRYKNAQEATLKDFSVHIPKGEILAILGESGSGKSTVLRLIAGLEEPLSGFIKVAGKALVSDQLFVQPEKRGIGMVFQDYALFPHMTVASNIEFGLKNISKVDKQKRLNEVLRLVDLEGYANRYPHELSGGQQQRVALARAIAPKPAVMLLDEPFSNLDANLKSRIRQELKQILSQAGITSIFVTHDQEDAISIADSVVILHKGEIEKIGRPLEVL
ncbi:ABC transporter ATP-binding protein [Clostridiaceae bacterium 35-E11]